MLEIPPRGKGKDSQYPHMYAAHKFLLRNTPTKIKLQASPRYPDNPTDRASKSYFGLGGCTKINVIQAEISIANSFLFL